MVIWSAADENNQLDVPYWSSPVHGLIENGPVSGYCQFQVLFPVAVGEDFP